MTKKRIILFLSTFFIFGVTVLTLYVNVTKPRVMVIHSYDPDYAWTRDITAGLRRVFKNHPHYSIKWHYMDTKRHNNKSFLRKASIIAREAVNHWAPNVLIVIDDDASELVGKYYVNDPEIKVVFAGLNGEYSPYGYDKANNVTGIMEHKQLTAIKETIQTIEANKKAGTGKEGTDPVRLMYIADPSTSLATDRKLIDGYDWSPLAYMGSSVAKDYEEWKRYIKDAGTKADYLIIANYRNLARGGSTQDTTLVPAKEAMAWTQVNSPVPVLGLNVFNVEDGGMLAVGASPFEQGEVAARQAVEIIDNKTSPKNIPIVENKHFVIAMRKTLLDARGIVLPNIYEVFARSMDNYRD